MIFVEKSEKNAKKNGIHKYFIKTSIFSRNEKIDLLYE